MDNVVLFETTQGYYGIYDTVSELLYDRVGREIYDINDILYTYNYLILFNNLNRGYFFYLEVIKNF